MIYTLGNLTIDDIVLYNAGQMYLGCSGGDALFSAIGAWIWQEHVGLIARAGQSYPQANLQQIEEAGITCHLRRVPGNDIRNWALYEPDGSRQFVQHCRSGSYAQLSITGTEIPEECLGAAAYHIAPMPVEAQVSVVQRLRGDPHPALSLWEREKQPCLITLDTFPQHLKDENAIRTALSLVAQVDAYLPSREEAAFLYGADDPQAAARAFAALGAQVVCIKMGVEGALLYQTQESVFHHIPIFPVKTVDPTGAGDAFCGGFLAGMLATGSPLLAACYGAVSASYVVQQVGALSMLADCYSDRETRLEKVSRGAKPLV